MYRQSVARERSFSIRRLRCLPQFVVFRSHRSVEGRGEISRQRESPYRERLQEAAGRRGLQAGRVGEGGARRRESARAMPALVSQARVFWRWRAFPAAGKTISRDRL